MSKQNNTYYFPLNHRNEKMCISIRDQTMVGTRQVVKASKSLPVYVHDGFIISQPRLTDESKRKILWDNAVDFYRFPESHMPQTFEEAKPLQGSD